MRYKLLHDLQFYYQKDVITIQLNEKNLQEREHIFDIEESAPYFVDVEEILSRDGKLEIVYNRPVNYTPLINFKEYADFYKLDILNRLLEMNVLEHEKTYLAMQNILLKDTRNLLFIYKADPFGNLPYAKSESMEQWKNFICSFFGKYPLAKYEQKRSELLEKEKNPFLTAIEGTKNLTDLTRVVKEQLTQEQKAFFANELQKKKVTKRQVRSKRALKSVVVIGILIIYTTTILALKASEKRHVSAVQQDAKTEITILNKIIDNDSENIAKDMQQLNYPKQKQIDIYIKLGDYTKAYDLNHSADKKIIQILYKQGKIEKIKNLDLPQSEYLADVKRILTYETASDVEYLVQTSNDPFLLGMLVDQAVKKRDVALVQMIRQVPIKQKKIALDSQRQISMIDLLIDRNNDELENITKDDSLSGDAKRQQINDFLEENNHLLSEKVKLKE